MNTTTQPTPRSSSPAPAWTLHAAGTDAEIIETRTGLSVAQLCGATPEALALMLAAPEMAEALRDLLALTEALRDHVKHNLNGADLLAPASPRIAKARALLARINGNT